MDGPVRPCGHPPSPALDLCLHAWVNWISFFIIIIIIIIVVVVIIIIILLWVNILFFKFQLFSEWKTWSVKWLW